MATEWLPRLFPPLRIPEIRSKFKSPIPCGDQTKKIFLYVSAMFPLVKSLKWQIVPCLSIICSGLLSSFITDKQLIHILFSPYFYLQTGTCKYISYSMIHTYIKESFTSVLERSIAACSRGEHQISAIHHPKSTDCSISNVFLGKAFQKQQAYLGSHQTWEKRRWW